MTEPSDDPTMLNASERDLLVALASCEIDDPERATTTPEWRDRAISISARFTANGTGVFYQARDRLVEKGLVTVGDHPDDARMKYAGLTLDGEEALNRLAMIVNRHAKEGEDV